LPVLILPVLAVIASMISIQWGASLAKQLFPILGIPATAMLRTVLAAAILAVYAKPWRGPRLSREAAVSVIGYGLAMGAMNLLFYLAIARIHLGIAVALQFLGPLCVTLSHARRLVDLLWAALAMAGIIMLMPGSQQPNREVIDLVGVGYALVGAGCWAAYIIFGKRSSRYVPGMRVTALGMAVAAIAMLPLGMMDYSTPLMNETFWVYAPIVAILSCAIPYSLEMMAMTRIPSKTFGVLMSLEPAIAAIFGQVNLRESIYLEQWLGIVAIVIASAGSIVSLPD